MRNALLLQQAYEYIKEDSLTNAGKVKEGILKIIESLPDHPEKHPPDKYKEVNKGNYRAFEKYSYRIAYKITEKEIKISQSEPAELQHTFASSGSKIFLSGRQTSRPGLRCKQSYPYLYFIFL